MLSPSATPPSTRRAATRRDHPRGVGANSATVPASSTMPVNIPTRENVIDPPAKPQSAGAGRAQNSQMTPALGRNGNCSRASRRTVTWLPATLTLRS